MILVQSHKGHEPIPFEELALHKSMENLKLRPINEPNASLKRIFQEEQSNFLTVRSKEKLAEYFLQF